MSSRSHNPASDIYGRQGAIVRLVYLAGAAVMWTVTLGGRLGARQNVILCYHSVTDAQRSRFERQVKMAQGRSAALDRVSEQPTGFSRPRICFTFDDAFACLLRNALPTCASADVPTSVFAVSGNLGKTPEWEMNPGHPERNERVMTREELVQASQIRGCTIGSHGVAHRALAKISRADAMEELRMSKTELEAMLGLPIKDYAAAYGSYTPEIADAAIGVGYARFLTLDPRGVQPNSGTLGRYQMSPDVWPIEFKLTVTGSYSWVHRVRRLVRAMRGNGQRQSQATPSQIVRSST